MAQLRLTVVLLVGLLIGTTTTALARAITTTTTEVVPIVIESTNPCTGEPLLVEGVGHVVIHETTDASGGLTQINFGAFTGSARGLESDTRYRLVNVQLDNQAHFSADGASETTDVLTIHFIALGNTQESFYSQITHHSTFNANGELTTVALLVRSECQ